MNPFKIKFITKRVITEKSTGIAADFIKEIVGIRHEEKNRGLPGTVSERSAEAFSDRKKELDEKILIEYSENGFFKTVTFKPVEVNATIAQSRYTINFEYTLYSEVFTCIGILAENNFVYYGEDKEIKFSRNILQAVIVND